MNDIDPAIMNVLSPEQSRHWVLPVYSYRAIYYCITELREINPQDGLYDTWFIYEAFSEDELSWLDANARPAGCDHALIAWQYWQDPVARTLLEHYRASMPRDPFDDLEPASLRADLEAALDQILGR